VKGWPRGEVAQRQPSYSSTLLRFWWLVPCNCGAVEKSREKTSAERNAVQQKSDFATALLTMKAILFWPVESVIIEKFGIIYSDLGALFRPPYSIVA
jgi:hypothetical protein